MREWYITKQRRSASHGAGLLGRAGCNAVAAVAAVAAAFAITITAISFIVQSLPLLCVRHVP